MCADTSKESVVKAKPNSLLDKVVNQLSNSQAGTSASQSAASAISKYANLFTMSAASAAASAASAAKNVANNSGSAGAGITSPTATGSRQLQGSGSGAQGLKSPEVGKVELQRSGTQKGDAAGRKGEPEDKPLPADGVLSAQLAERMLKWHAEAVGRIVELSPPGDV